MREHADYYKQFIDVNPGGGIRRNPKRKGVAVNTYQPTSNFVPPTEADIDRVFDSHLQSMARGGTYGDNMEITAFSSAFDCDVRIYQRDFAYVVSGGEESSRPVAHIAYHNWEHYSSIRNLDGPHTGLPEVAPKALSPQEEQRQKEKLEQTPHVLPWQIDVVSKSLPFLADKPAIKRALEAAKGNIDAAVSNLLEAEENGSNSSSHQESSSIERDLGSDDDAETAAPKKKQDRRMSRAARALKELEPYNKPPVPKVTYNGSQESFSSWDSETSFNASQPSPRRSAANKSTPSTTPSSTQPTSVSDGTTPAPPRPTVRLKLLPPRPPPGKEDRVPARDKKDFKKQAQKAARKERQLAAAQNEQGKTTNGSVDLSMRTKDAHGTGVVNGTPPVDTLRTLYI
jgi:hypothetical protein